MKKWQPLKKGDIIDLIAPSFSMEQKEIDNSVEYIKFLGLVPRIPKKMINKDLFFANSDKARFIHLRDALLAKDSKAIWCLRGGYGCARLLPELNKIKTPKNCKAVIGFSDITALHIFLNQKWKWNTIHGTVLGRLPERKIDKESERKTTSLVLGKNKTQEFTLTPLNKCEGKPIKSSVSGGNLTIVQNSIGTDWQLDAKNKIILLEEVDEKPYQIDRSLNHIMQSGILKKASAIIFGDFNTTEFKMDEGEKEEVLRRFAVKINIPVLKIPGVGHTEKNYPVPLGTKSTLSLGSVCTLASENGHV